MNNEYESDDANETRKSFSFPHHFYDDPKQSEDNKLHR